MAYLRFCLICLTGRAARKGQAISEYALALALITMFCLLALTAMGESISTMMEDLADTIQGIIG